MKTERVKEVLLIMKNGKVIHVPPEDKCLIYYSKSDDCWVAHGLFVDQIGTGQSMLVALIDLLTGIENLRKLAKREKDIEFFRMAPEPIQQRAKHADRLPLELYSVAYKKVRGEWPEDIQLATETNKKHVLVIA